MSLDQKLGQMMIVQFVGPTYSLDISTMISQYHVGAVLLFTANNNISDKIQLKGLIQQMQSNSAVPMIVAIDQEGGTVDRLQALDGPRSAAADIGATNDPEKAKAAGIQDAQDLASYGFNLNLAPVVDVTNVYNPQLYDRTYGNNAALVTRMAQAYLQGLQQSGKVLGTLKHFPGLGDVGVDPHSGVPNLYRSKNDLEAIDWTPYRTLIQQGNVHAIMVTHELVHAIDSSTPSSLSYKVVTGILRNELGFQGVIMTDSLTMESITAYYSEDQAAAVAVEAGSDLLMGASTPADVASMIQGIKQAIDSGMISQQRIDDSVRRILMLKYQMGLLPIPNN
jgi:beta-N-acetylhexosaminidase